jgi:hypothetical protein
MSIITDPIVNLPFLYINGLNMSQTTATATSFAVSAGQCRDNTNTYDLTLKSNTTVNVNSIGLNGLDTGTFAASTVYYVYLIADSQGYNQTGVIISTNKTLPAMPNPLNPKGSYTVYRRIGSFASLNTPNVPIFYQIGSGSTRELLYDSPVQVAYTPTTSFSTCSLAVAVPSFAPIKVSLSIAYNTSVAGGQINARAYNPAGGLESQINLSAVVATETSRFAPFDMIAMLNNGAPTIQLQTANTSDIITILVNGFVDNL